MKSKQQQNFMPVSDATNTSVRHDRPQCLTQCTPVSSTTDASVCQSPVQPTRKCRHCGQDLPVSAFYTRDQRHKPDSYCKECRKTANRIRRKADETSPKEEVAARCYPVITNIGQREVRLQLILNALQTVRENMARKRRKRCEREYFS